MKIIIGIIIALIVIAVIWHFANRKPIEGSAIRIGFAGPLSGDAATYGEPMKNAAALAVEQINASGGINGRPLEVVYEDTRCNGKDALNAIQKLVNIDQIRIITGFACAADLLVAAPVTEQNKVLVLAPGASGPDLTNVGKYIFKNNPSYSGSAKSIAESILKNHKNIALISEQSVYASGIEKVFAKEFVDLGANIVSQVEFQSGTRDFRSMLLKIKESNPDAIFLNPQTEISGGTILKQAREIGIQAQFFSHGTLEGEKTREIAGSAAENLIIFATPELDKQNKKASDFLLQYKKEFGEPVFELYLGTSYDAIYLIADAVAKFGLDTDKIRDYLSALKGYDGVVGRYSFDKNGDMVGINFDEKQIKNGALVPYQN